MPPLPQGETHRARDRGERQALRGMGPGRARPWPSQKAVWPRSSSSPSSGPRGWPAPRGERRASGGRAGLWLRGHSGWLCGERCTGSCEQRPRGSHRRQRRTRQGPPVRERRRGSAPARRCTVSAARLPAPRALSPLGTASRQVIPEPSVPRGSQCPVVAQAGSAVPAAPAEQSGPGGPGAGGWEEWRADRRAARHRD